MRVNSRVHDERADMLGNIQIPNCQPTDLRKVAENIMNMVTKVGYNVGDYNTMVKLDKLLTWDYWREYDDLFCGHHNEIEEREVKEWFVGKSTPEDLISRARRWLQSHNYLIIKSEVADRAHSAGEKFSQAVKG